MDTRIIKDNNFGDIQSYEDIEINIRGLKLFQIMFLNDTADSIGYHIDVIDSALKSGNESLLEKACINLVEKSKVLECRLAEFRNAAVVRKAQYKKRRNRKYNNNERKEEK